MLVCLTTAPEFQCIQWQPPPWAFSCQQHLFLEFQLQKVGQQLYFFLCVVEGYVVAVSAVILYLHTE